MTLDVTVMEEVRIYARGVLNGQSAACLDEAMAYRREALVLVALRELGVSPPAAKAILEQARHDAYCAVPDCTEFAARLIGAEMVCVILRQRLSHHKNLKVECRTAELSQSQCG